MSFETAKNLPLYTAIISDLHLTDAEPALPDRKVRSPLWKKFKTPQFFIDGTLEKFLLEIEKKSNGNPIELILNGDIFDFDSVMSQPVSPIFRVHWLEKRRGLFPREDRSLFKMQVILSEHERFILALSAFIKRGNWVILIPGNHDVELFFEKVQHEFYRALSLTAEEQKRVKFADWFYISNADTLVEHGHQQDPYCLCENPLNPFLVDYNEVGVKLPFGNVATRYIMNGMGLFNPHVEANYIMSLNDYLKFFFKYLITTQPLIMWTWFWGSVMTLYQVIADKFREPFRPRVDIENRVHLAAIRSNATPYMVRRMQELFASPATNNPWMIAKELWLDRAFLIAAGMFGLFLIVYELKSLFGISLYWTLLPYILLLPFFFFYARSVKSMVSDYKEPDEWILSQQAEVTGVSRIVYGHTHIARHEYYGSIEHLNSGTWSPGFVNVECTESVLRNNYVWIEPVHPQDSEAEKASTQEKVKRRAELCQFIDPNWMPAKQEG